MRFFFYQNQFDNIYRKYITYTGGEELFGLPVTPYPQLLEIKKQLNLLQKIYSLYNSVIDTVNSYQDSLWSEVNIEKINNELLEFQSRSEIKRLAFAEPLESWFNACVGGEWFCGPAGVSGACLSCSPTVTWWCHPCVELSYRFPCVCTMNGAPPSELPECYHGLSCSGESVCLCHT